MNKPREIIETKQGPAGDVMRHVNEENLTETKAQVGADTLSEETTDLVAAMTLCGMTIALAEAKGDTENMGLAYRGLMKAATTYILAAERALAQRTPLATRISRDDVLDTSDALAKWTGGIPADWN